MIKFSCDGQPVRQPGFTERAGNLCIAVDYPGHPDTVILTVMSSGDILLQVDIHPALLMKAMAGGGRCCKILTPPEGGQVQLEEDEDEETMD